MQPHPAPAIRTSDLPLRLLVIRCQLGDANAFAQLLAHYQPRLRAYLFKMSPGNAASLDDLLQEIWTDVFKDLGRLSDPAAFTPWLYRIARNRLFRSTRRNQLPTQPIQESADIASPDEESFTPDDAAAVHAALDQLPPQMRDVLLLRFIEDMTYGQIAAVLEIPIGTVRSRIHNAKQQLKTILSQVNP